MNTPSLPAATGRGRRLAGLSLVLPVAVLTLLAGCHHAPPEQAKKPVEVVVTTPVPDEVADYQDFTGRLDGLMTVEIRAHVSGYVMKAPFKEGDPVREGDLLFQIDPRTFEAALNQTEANLKVAIAERDLQAKNAQRARKMIGSNSMSREDYDTMIASHNKAEANVGAMEAAREMARVNLDYTRVTAPLTGRISRRFVDPGNLVTADNTILTTLVSDHQLYAYFDVDERTYLDLVGLKAQESEPGKDGGSQASPGPSALGPQLQFPVLMSLANEGTKFGHVGKVDFIDNRVNATTGTVRMRGVFDNPNGLLKSGLFVRIRLPLGKPYKTLLLSGEALQSDQGRSYVYVVNDKNEVVYRRVTVGQELHGLRVIRDGLKEGERVIVSGMQRVRPGAQVEAKVQPPPKPPESPLVRMLNSYQSGQTASQPDRRTEKQADREKTGAGSGPADTAS